MVMAVTHEERFAIRTNTQRAIDQEARRRSRSAEIIQNIIEDPSSVQDKVRLLLDAYEDVPGILSFDEFFEGLQKVLLST